MSRDIEGPIQKTIVDGLRALLPSDWIVMHVRNNPRSRITGAREKRNGAIAGWPDIQIIGSIEDVPFVGFIEVKTRTGVLSKEQKEVLGVLSWHRHHYGVARSWDDAVALAQVWQLPLRSKPSRPQVAA